MSGYLIACVILCVISLAIAIFAIVKVSNMTRKIASVSEFINGNEFSDRFHSMLTDYLSDPKNSPVLVGAPSSKPLKSKLD